MRKRTTCPECGSADIVEVVYGMPTPETVERADRGEVVVGGCCLPIPWGDELVDSDRLCRECGTSFASRPPRQPAVLPLTVVPAPFAPPRRPTTQRRMISLRPETYGQVIEPRQPKRATRDFRPRVQAPRDTP